jgi:hypothetical protein
LPAERSHPVGLPRVSPVNPSEKRDELVCAVEVPVIEKQTINARAREDIVLFISPQKGVSPLPPFLI